MLKLTIYVEPHTPEPVAPKPDRLMEFLSIALPAFAAMMSQHAGARGAFEHADDEEEQEEAPKYTRADPVQAEARVHRAPTAADEEAPAVVRHQHAVDPFLVESEKIQVGSDAFGKLVGTWAHNFGVAEAPQPDRRNALMGCLSLYGSQASAYFRERGGLVGAIADSLLRQGLHGPEGVNLLAKKIAGNMIQVASTQGFPELQEFLERSVYQEREHDDSPPRGPMLKELNLPPAPSHSILGAP